MFTEPTEFVLQEIIMPPLGIGYFFDRLRQRYVRIDEHATDAVTRPSTFRAQAVAHLDPVTDRDLVVRHVAQKGFIRVRHYKDRLGWEFFGGPEQALKVLRRYLRRHQVGPFVQINLSDFKSGRSICVSASDVLNFTSARSLGLVKTKLRSTK